MLLWFLRSNGQASSIPNRQARDCVTFLPRHDHGNLVSMFVGDLAGKENSPPSLSKRFPGMQFLNPC